MSLHREGAETHEYALYVGGAVYFNLYAINIQYTDSSDARRQAK